MNAADKILFDNTVKEAVAAAHIDNPQKSFKLLMKAAHMQWLKTQEPQRLAS